MKNIDDKTIETAFSNLKKMRKLKPCFVILGVIMLALAGVLGRLVYLVAQHPIPAESSGLVLFRLAAQIVLVAFLIFQGMFLLCSGLFRNNKDIILEHLAEQYLKEKKEPKEDSG